MTDCVCPGDVVTFECTVCSGIAAVTVWTGSGFQCTNDILLRHSNFERTGNESKICNDGQVVGRIESAQSGCFISKLNVTYTDALQNSTVECSADNGTVARKIGSEVLNRSTGMSNFKNTSLSSSSTRFLKFYLFKHIPILNSDPFSPPQNIRLTGVKDSELIFSWNEAGICPSLSYNIVSRNCGVCPNSTSATSVTCTNFTLTGTITLCALMIEAVICSEGMPIVGFTNTSTVVNLTGKACHNNIIIISSDINNCR